MKTDLAHHYKDREPEETIKIIENFFHKYNFDIKVCLEVESVSGTFGYNIKLYYKDIFIQGANGKGLTKSYAKASAYAELYERFCNGESFYTSYLLIRILLEQHYKKHGYYMDKNEIIPKTISEELNNDTMLKFYNAICENDEELMNDIINNPINNYLFTVPYKSVFSDEVKYYNPIVVMRNQGSNGMVAGNTLEEALNQGISELLERDALFTLLNSDNIVLYQINESTFPIELKNIADKIQADNNRLLIFDLSYTTNTPVIMGIIFNSKTKNVVTKLGCFPVFDIALERVFTELYQNRNNFSEFDRYLTVPSKETPIENYIFQVMKSTAQTVFPEFLLDNIINIDTYNHSVFLKDTVNNIEILQYYNELFKNTGNELYYYDNSLDKDIKALTIFSPQLSIQRIPEVTPGELNIKKKAAKYIKKFYNCLYNFITYDDLDPFLFYSYDVYMDKNLCKYIDTFSFNSSPLFPFEKIETETRNFINEACYAIIFGELNATITDEDMCRMIKNKYNSSIIIKYMVLLRYVNTNKYNFEELKNIFNNFSDLITEEDCEKIYQPTYLFNKLFLEPFKNTYSLKNLFGIMKPFIEKD